MSTEVEYNAESLPGGPSVSPEGASSERGAELRRARWLDERRVIGKIGRYAVLGQIAGGGMGSVFVAQMRGPAAFSRLVALRDDDSQTPTHLRLTAASDDGLWQWVWDFYVTHVVFTVNRAPLPFGFAYQGVPGGSLGTEDRLGSNDGVVQGARNSFNADLFGPVEWAYLADTTLGRSLFAMQHRDDDLPERYQVRDNDTSLLSFGNGQLQVLPQRFSLGLIPSVSPAAIAERVEFVAGAVP